MLQPPVRRHTMQGLLALLLAWACLLGNPAWAQNVELPVVRTSRSEGSLDLEFVVRLSLPRAVEDALHRGVQVYFVAEAQLLRNRWYWRDERVARVQRTWRVAYQPLTGNWRVGLGGLNQTLATLTDALATVSSAAGWKLADLSQLDPEKSYYVEFSYRLDNSQLPGPMQFALGGPNDWAVSGSRVVKAEFGP